MMLLGQAAHHARRGAAGATTRYHHIRRGDEGWGEGRWRERDWGLREGAGLLLART